MLPRRRRHATILRIFVGRSQSSWKPRRKWRIGVIGCGAWGPNHVRNFAALPNADVVGAADLQPDRLARVKAIVPGIATFTDADAMLAITKPDAVVVSTPTMTHFDVVRQALLAGTHVLCEKPLCLTGQRGRRPRGAGRRARLRLMVGHVFMFNPGILKLQGTGQHRRPGQPPLLPVRPADEPRPDPQRRERGARPRVARRLDLQLPARRRCPPRSRPSASRSCSRASRT